MYLVQLLNTQIHYSNCLFLCHSLINANNMSYHYNQIMHDTYMNFRVSQALCQNKKLPRNSIIVPTNLNIKLQMYELMIMAVKHQIQTIRNPRHLVMITLNHLDAMQDYTNNADLQKSIYLAYEHLINVSKVEMILKGNLDSIPSPSP